MREELAEGAIEAQTVLLVTDGRVQQSGCFWSSLTDPSIRVTK